MYAKLKAELRNIFAESMQKKIKINAVTCSVTSC